MGFSTGTQERIRNSGGKRVIGVRANEGLVVWPYSAPWSSRTSSQSIDQRIGFRLSYVKIIALCPYGQNDIVDHFRFVQLWLMLSDVPADISS